MRDGKWIPYVVVRGKSAVEHNLNNRRILCFGLLLRRSKNTVPGGIVDHFEHEKLDVYQAGIELVAVADDIINELPRGRSHLADQLHRAGTSIPLNIAEGAGEFAKNEKARFYRIARRSATEAAAILDVLRRLQLSRSERLDQGRALLLRVVAMTTAMILRGGKPDDPE